MLSRKIEDELGGEEDTYGFRSAMMFVQVSDSLDLVVAAKVAAIFASKLPRQRNKPSFVILKGRDEIPKLIGPVRHSATIGMLTRERSQQLNQHDPAVLGLAALRLKPKGVWSYPNNTDLCVVVYDGTNLVIDPEAMACVEQSRANWVWVGAPKGGRTSVSTRPDHLMQSSSE